MHLIETIREMMINNQTGYYDLNNGNLAEIGATNVDNSSEADVLNTTPFSVRDILNIVDQNNSDENLYHNMSDPYSQRFLVGNGAGGQYGAQYGKRWEFYSERSDSVKIKCMNAIQQQLSWIIEWSARLLWLFLQQQLSALSKSTTIWLQLLRVLQLYHRLSRLQQFSAELLIE